MPRSGKISRSTWRRWRWRSDCHVVAIASGGCNILSYLTADPARITAVDLSQAHVALNRLKLAAAQHLLSWEAFYRFFGAADSRCQPRAYDMLIAPHLDEASRAYWDGRKPASGRRRRRISIFARNVYRHGVLGRFIGAAHVARARLWRELEMAFSGGAYPGRAAPLLRHRHGAVVRQDDRCAGRPSSRLSLYGLGIPPAQYEALAGGPRHGARCCATGSSGWPAASAWPTTTSPGRPSAAPMRGCQAAAAAVSAAARISSRCATGRRSGRGDEPVR